MKNITGILAILALVTTAAQASLNLGLSALFDDNDLGSEVGIAIPQVGWQLTNNDQINHTVEAELMFLSMEGNSGVVNYDGRAIPLMLNYRLDWTPNDIFGLYTGLGLGFSFNDMDSGAYTDKGTGEIFAATDIGDTEFAYQLQLGVSLTFLEQLRFNLGYRYLDTGDQDGSVIGNMLTDMALGVDGDHHIIDLGFRYDF